VPTEEEEYSSQSVSGKTTTQYWSYSGIQRKLVSPAHLQNVCCFGIPTYHSSRRRFGNDHANVQQNEKLILFLDCHVQQLIENQNVPIEMWIIIKHRHRTNNAGEGWNSKLNSFIGKQQPNVFLQVQKLKRKMSWYIGN
jgi:hypothetical protein